jgi:hypothetical protein
MIFITVVVLGSIIVNIVSIFISGGISLNFGQNLLGILATLAGSLVAIVLALATYYQISKERQKLRLLESVEQQQKEELVRLSQQESELEKQRTNLEKQQQTLLWILAAAERITDDPRLAIIIAYQGLESEIQSLITRKYQVDTEDARPGFSVSYNYDMLTGYIDPDEARVIMQMHDLRNRIIHGEVSPKEITEDKVRDYIQSAGRIAQEISQIGRFSEA